MAARGCQPPLVIAKPHRRGLFSGCCFVVCMIPCFINRSILHDHHLTTRKGAFVLSPSRRLHQSPTSFSERCPPARVALYFASLPEAGLFPFRKKRFGFSEGSIPPAEIPAEENLGTNPVPLLLQRERTTAGLVSSKIPGFPGVENSPGQVAADKPDIKVAAWEGLSNE